MPFVRPSLDKRPAGRASVGVVDALPQGTLAIVGSLAIGPDWVAKGHRGKWSVIPIGSLASVTVVAPAGWKQFMSMSAFIAPPPDLVFATSDGVAFRIPINQVDGRARAALLSVLSQTMRVSRVARRFLESKGLPDGWDRQFQFVGFRFGRPYQ